MSETTFTESQNNSGSRSPLSWSRDIQRAVQREGGMDTPALKSLISQASGEGLGAAFTALSTRALSEEKQLGSDSQGKPPTFESLQFVADHGEALSLLMGKVSPVERFNAATEALRQGVFADSESPSALLLSGIPLNDERLPAVLREAEQASSRGLPLLLDAVGSSPAERAHSMGAAIKQAAVMNREDAFMHLMGAAGYPTLDSGVAAQVALKIEDRNTSSIPSPAIAATVASYSALETPEDGARVAALIKSSGLAEGSPKDNAEFLKDAARHIKDPEIKREITTLDPLALASKACALCEQGAQSGLNSCCEKIRERRGNAPEIQVGTQATPSH